MLSGRDDSRLQSDSGNRVHSLGDALDGGGDGVNGLGDESLRGFQGDSFRGRRGLATSVLDTINVDGDISTAIALLSAHNVFLLVVGAHVLTIGAFNLKVDIVNLELG